MPEFLPTRAELMRLVPRGGRIAELGVLHGNFSAAICEICQPRELVLIDCWRFQPGEYEADKSDAPQAEQDARFAAVCQRFATYPEVKIQRAFTIEAVASVPGGYFDCVYLDACHLREAVDRDLANWYPKVRKGGLFCGHDYWQVDVPFIQVRPAVDAFCAARGLMLDFITEGHCGSWGMWKR